MVALTLNSSWVCGLVTPRFPRMSSMSHSCSLDRQITLSVFHSVFLMTDLLFDSNSDIFYILPRRKLYYSVVKQIDISSTSPT